MTHRPVYKAHQRAAAAKRRRDTLALYVEHPGWTYYDIGQAVGISARHAGDLVREALQQVAADERDMAQVALARSMRMHLAAMEAAWEIVQKPCGKCGGAGQIVDDEKGRTLDNAGNIVTAMQPCTLCEYSSGYAYPYQARLGAIDRHQRALENLNKLLRLDEPDTLNINVNFRADLAGLPDAELQRMLGDYVAGYTSPLALPPGQTSAQEDVA